MLTIENIACARSGQILFQNLGLCLTEGAFLLIKGANGSGKTSMIDIIAGKLAPTEGQILWNDTNIKQAPYPATEMIHIGHSSDIDERRTVVDNLARWAKPFGTETLMNAALHYYDLEPHRNTKAEFLSAGLKRRLALSRLIVSPCRLWLLDEPTNFLDEESLLLTTSLIETRVQQGGIVIVATHIMTSSVDSHTLHIADFQELPTIGQ